MMALNRQMNLPALQKIMAEFQKQSELMDMKSEVRVLARWHFPLTP
jgi:hypothetical protein